MNDCLYCRSIQGRTLLGTCQECDCIELPRASGGPAVSVNFDDEDGTLVLNDGNILSFDLSQDDALRLAHYILARLGGEEQS